MSPVPTEASISVGRTHLPTIMLSRLQTRDSDEIQSLYNACSQDGFMYLDLRDQETLLKEYEEVHEIIKGYFNQPLDVKMKDDCKSDNIGYEPVATSAGAVNNLPDYYESFKISRDQVVCGSSGSDLTTSVKDNFALFESYMSRVHGILSTILSCLSDAMGLEDNSRLESFHRDNAVSQTNITFLKYPKQTSASEGVGHNKHTDIGTLTFLISSQWGLQTLTSEGWRYVEPKPGFAVINVGDSLRFLSNRRLRSVVHRVLPLGQHQTEDRYTLAYFLRPEDDTLLKDSNGRNVSAKSWHDLKFDHFREPHDKQNADSILTGGMERNGELLRRDARVPA